MKIALLSCSKRKKNYPCAAGEMYSESNIFRLALEYAEKTCDKIFVLSAKYGLAPINAIISPYDKTLNDVSEEEKKAWADGVIDSLKRLTNIDKDDYLILAGINYNKYLLSHIKKYHLPLKGKRLFEWVPTLEEMIKNLDKTDTISDKDSPSFLVEEIHQILNKKTRYSWQDLDRIKVTNGIYIFFEKGEKYSNLDRIVRIGTHRSDGRLVQRLKDHYLVKNKDGSIFRKHIGAAILNKDRDNYLETWNLNTSYKNVREQNKDKIDLLYQEHIEDRVSVYLKSNLTFTIFQVKNQADRIRIEEGIISSLNKCPDFKASSHWLGNYSIKTEIKNSGLWNIQGLDSPSLNYKDLDVLNQEPFSRENKAGIIKEEANNPILNNKLDDIWSRIIEYQGEIFKLKMGKEFTYSVNRNTIYLSYFNATISKETIGEVLDMVPLSSTAEVQKYYAPSYIYGILMDKRIRSGYW